MKYLGIQLWHLRTGSRQYYIDRLIERATEEYAPEDAIYKDHDTGEWVCVSDLDETHSFRTLWEENRK